MLRRLSLLLVVVLTTLLGTTVSAKTRTHKVRRGQLLGSIARMYGVPVKALCTANGVNCSRPLIKPGQVLVIPARSDKDGRRAAARRARRSKKPSTRRKTRRGAAGARWHTVRKGQLLGSIAKSYGVSSKALCRANDINCNRPLIRPGQALIVPAAGDTDGNKARKARRSGRAKPSAASTDKRSRSGRLRLRRGQRTWKGQALRRGQVTRAARKGFKQVLATRGGAKKTIHPRLIKLISKVSDHFGGRTIEVVSGYRTTRAGPGSRHRKGRAIDFRVQGISNKKVLAYIKKFNKVGVGYYPNSGFLHLDVRATWTHWIDYAGPGQPARYGGFWTRRSK